MQLKIERQKLSGNDFEWKTRFGRWEVGWDLNGCSKLGVSCGTPCKYLVQKLLVWQQGIRFWTFPQCGSTQPPRSWGCFQTPLSSVPWWTWVHQNCWSSQVGCSRGQCWVPLKSKHFEKLMLWPRQNSVLLKLSGTLIVF